VTLGDLPYKKQLHFVKETMDTFAPLANMFGNFDVECSTRKPLLQAL